MCPAALRSLVIQPRERRLERVAEGDRLDRLEVAHQVRGQAEDHRGLPLAGVAHPVLDERARRPRAGCAPRIQ